MNKTIKLIALASCTGAIAFFGYKFYKEVKRVKAEHLSVKRGDGEALATGLSLSVDKALEEELKRNVELDEEDYARLVEDHYGISTSGPDNIVYVDEEIEVEELKYEPNSVEALQQYRDMLCSDLNHLGQNKTILMKLLDIPINFTGKEDNILREKLVEDRYEFFGDSRWVEEVSVGDVVYHFARLTDFDIDGGIDMWFSQFMYNMEITAGVGIVSLEQKLERLERHVLTTSVGYGMFGLTKDQFNRSVSKANAPLGNTRASFGRQYNVFIEDMVEQIALNAE